MADATRKLRLKVVVCGDAAVGKSCLIKRHTEGKFVARYISTIGVDYGVLPAEVSGHTGTVRINFFDMSGDDTYLEIRNEFYKDTQALLLVYDVSQRSSYERLSAWLEEARKCGLPPGVRTLVCGNKTDLARAVSADEARSWAAERGLPYYETSASTNDGIADVFQATFAAALATATGAQS